jgi:GT2 family glycosyltransferase
MEEPTYSVIIVTYQRDLEVQATLSAILAQSVRREAMEICVVDNGGAERTRAAWADRVDIWVDSQDNLGCAGGRNRGAEATRAPILVFVDDDGIPGPDFVERLGEVLHGHPDAVAVRGRAVALNHPLLTAMASHYHRGSRVCEDLLTLEGGSAVRRGPFEAVGGYDASRAYHEGVELSGRLLEAHPGTTILYTPNAVLRHDFLRGWRHFLSKARMTALADDRVDTEGDTLLADSLTRLRQLPIVDGRRLWQKVAGRLIKIGFNFAKKYYRWRALPRLQSTRR